MFSNNFVFVEWGVFVFATTMIMGAKLIVYVFALFIVNSFLVFVCVQMAPSKTLCAFKQFQNEFILVSIGFSMALIWRLLAWVF